MADVVKVAVVACRASHKGLDQKPSSQQKIEKPDYDRRVEVTVVARRASHKGRDQKPSSQQKDVKMIVAAVLVNQHT